MFNNNKFLKKSLELLKFYKKNLIFFGFCISLYPAKISYNYLQRIQFKNKISKIDPLIKEKKYIEIDNIFQKCNSQWINNQQLFLKCYIYMKYIDILHTELPKEKNLIERGDWPNLIKIANKIENNCLKNKLLKILNSLEKIYQFVKNKNPYSCSLSIENTNYSGELLNLMVFLHIANREDKKSIIVFYYKSSLQASIFPTFTSIIYNWANKMDSYSINPYSLNFEDTNLQFIKDLIKF